MTIKGCEFHTRPETDDYLAVVNGKKYKCSTIRGCFKAANGRWPKDQAELDKFINLVVYGNEKGGANG